MFSLVKFEYFNLDENVFKAMRNIVGELANNCFYSNIMKGVVFGNT